MDLSEVLIRQMMPNAGARLTPHLKYIVPALEWGKIVTPLDVAAFFAHLAHESGEYKYMEELASGDDYDQRTDLGNTPEIDGDGRWFKGHGPIQITGHDAHLACGVALGIDLIKNPKLLTLPEYGTVSAVWFWTKYKPWLQPASKRGWFKVTQRLVNGGTNGWGDRLNYYVKNRKLLGLPTYTEIGELDSIIQFQKDMNLMPDGQVGPQTLKKLLQVSIDWKERER
jgi:predicted chitinase